MNKLQHFIYWLKEARKNPSGLLPLTKDNRDLQIESVLGGWFGGYNPQSQSVRLTPTFTKDQRSRSNCSFQSGSNVVCIAVANALSIETGLNISPRYLTAKAYQQGLCGVNGWANLRSVLKIAQKFGACTEEECPSDESLAWGQYVGLDFARLDELAAQRKIGSYYTIKSVEDYYRAIDAKHAVCLGRTWMSSMNQGGGFSSPWILPRNGYAVGGHATCGVGYKLNYYGKQVSDELNSYGENWGDNGHFYCPMTDLANDIKTYGAYAVTDIIYNPKITTEKIISEYDGKNVRGNKSGGIYLIYDGQRFTYKDDNAFVSINGYPYSAKGAYIIVPQEAIDAVPYYGGSELASIIDGSYGTFSEMVKRLKKPINDNFNSNIEVSQ